MKRIAVAAVAALALAPAARAGGPAMLVGAAEDMAKQPTLVAAQANLDLLRLAGFDSVRVTAIWAPGERSPSETELRQLQNVAQAAQLTGMRVFVSVYNFGSRTTPLTDEARAEFADFAAAVARASPSLRDLIVGNEPNLNRFWLPQFNLDGSDAAAPAYLALLAQTYDALKAVDPGIRVIGGAVSPRGADRPDGQRPTHSPTVFIRDLGLAYRASGRTKPVMDWFAFHPYPESSSIPPSFAHPKSTSIGIADYAKLVSLLGEAFDGTAQPGSTLPILYAEFGIESQIPAEKASLYTGSEPATTKPVDEARQAASYREAISLAFCQPNVAGIFLFHAFDEGALDRFQSGLFYADLTPKASLRPVSKADRDARGGVIERCDDMQLTPQARVVFPKASEVAAGDYSLAVTCTIDCNVYARLEKLPRHSTTLVVRDRALAGQSTPLRFRKVRLARGSYRFTVRLTAPVNVGPPLALASRTLKIP